MENSSTNLVSPESQPARLSKMESRSVLNGDVAVKIYKNKGNVCGENFPTFLLSYYASGKRQLRRFMDFTKAATPPLSSRSRKLRARWARRVIPWSPGKVVAGLRAARRVVICFTVGAVDLQFGVRDEVADFWEVAPPPRAAHSPGSEERHCALAPFSLRLTSRAFMLDFGAPGVT